MRKPDLDKIQEFHARLASAESPVIVTHMKPDGDAIGSSLGMLHTLKLYEKNAVMTASDQAPANLDFLLSDAPEGSCIFHDRNKEAAEKAIAESDLIICLDFNAFHRTGTLEKALSESKADKILIDHHLSPDLNKFVLVFSETEVSSASELLYHIIKELPPIGGKVSSIPSKAATALMTGMTTDTNNFANSVYPSTLRMASELIEAGVDRDSIIRNIYNRFKESRIRLQGHILKDLMTITEDGVAYVVLDKKTLEKYNVEEGDTEGFVNIPLSIDKVVMSILAKEDNGYARVSIRSKKGISANRCSNLHFHGGGHENAAGGRIYFPEDVCSIEEAAGYIKSHTHAFMNENYE